MVTILPIRQCGECTMCCKAPQVPELEKAVNVLCTHCNSGCEIYEARPQSCKDFFCAWMQGDLANDMRPDKVGFMVEILPKEDIVFVSALNDAVLVNVGRVFDEYLNKGVSVVSSNGYALIATGATQGSVENSLLSAQRSMGVA